MDCKWTSFSQALLFHVRMVISFDGSYVGTPVESVRSVVWKSSTKTQWMKVGSTTYHGNPCETPSFLGGYNGV